MDEQISTRQVGAFPSEEQSHLGIEQKELWQELKGSRRVVQGMFKILEEKITQEGSYEDWVRLMRRERVVSITRRSVADIAREHSMSVNQFLELLKDKSVLNIGVGNSTLARELTEMNLKTKLVSLDVDKDSLDHQPGETILASGDAIPLPDESFDVILMTNSLPVWADSEEQAVKALNEAARLIAPDGVIKIAPIGEAGNRKSAHPKTGQIGIGLVGEIDPRFRMILARIDIATYDWLEKISLDPNFTVTLESATNTSWGADSTITSVSIMKHKRA